MTAFIVMGVSGAGKTTVARAFAAEAGHLFLDADDLHDAAAKAKMAAGVPLTDADREPWLDRVGERARNASGAIVIACSALRRHYRDRLRSWAPEARFIHLDLDVDVLERRVRGREHEYMAPSLLLSQVRALEPLEADEAGVTIAAGAPVATIVDLLRTFGKDTA